MAEPWPDLTGDKPDDWDPRHWLAAQCLHEGGTYVQAGELVGVKSGTISGWVQKWRAKYGSDFLASPRAGIIPQEVREKGAATSAALTASRWTDVRNIAAAELANLGRDAAEVAATGLQGLLAAPDRILALTVGDLLDLARLSDIMLKRADVLANVPDPTRALVVANTQVNTGGGSATVAPDLLAGLTGGESDSETLEAIEIIVQEFSDLHIEVDEVT